ncbi:hypothetical protein [Paenibacillus odorifer]|uniref:hypothetical protein n=1 Tax=Paenibacillus odorifer TaxID=189426 RepID=UPI00096CE7CE|nr:hypothetical protein [Paenibacillus odorifer]OMD07754.1 hypothetical protein BJP47_30285 [Paenibacillus odorifer]
MEQVGEKQKSALLQTMRTEADFLNSFMKEKSALKADFGQISGLLFSHLESLDSLESASFYWNKML